MPTATKDRPKTDRRVSLGLAKEFLECDLTTEDIADIAQRAGRMKRDIKAMENTVAEVKGKIKSVTADRERILFDAGRGKEKREVDVEQVKDFSAGMMLWIRQDTGEIEHHRPLTPREMQGKLDFETAVAAVDTATRFDGIGREDESAESDEAAA